MPDGPLLPTSRTILAPEERERGRRIVTERGLCGLANDTKWDEFIAAIRGRAPSEWRPSWRFRNVNGYTSGWDVEWWHHLPPPMHCVEWFDVGYVQLITEHRLPPRIHPVDHSTWLVPLLQQIGLDFEVGRHTIRIYGYAPRNRELFDE